MASRSHAVRIPAVKPLQRLSIIDRAELELRNAIYTGELRSGDPVPEVQVSSMMGISRSSLREACQRLVRDGLLTQYPGRGLFVTRFDAETSASFLEYRMAIEMQTVRILATRINRLRAGGDEAAITDLIAPLRRQLDAIEKGLDTERPIVAGNADLDLHLGLAEACRNPFLTTAMNTIVILTRMQSFADPKGYGVHVGLLQDHLALLDALEAGDADRAGQVLAGMIQQVGEQAVGGHDAHLLRDPELRQRLEPDFPTLAGG